MKTVTLQMIDCLTNEFVERTIDATNAYSSGVYCWELKGESEQRKNLNNWISERGNKQHKTELELISFHFNN
jgi:hypothetical protein